MNELLDFLLKDHSGAVVEFAEKARDEYVERAKELNDPCLGCGNYPIVGFFLSDTDVARNNYGPGLYCQECVNHG